MQVILPLEIILYISNNLNMEKKFMGYLSVWKVLEELMIDFRKKGMTIPPHVTSDLRSAKTLMNILKAENRQETSKKIEEYLFKVESYLIYEGQKKLGEKHVKNWLSRINRARSKIPEEKEEVRFISGVPREHNWIRVKPLAKVSLEKMKYLADNSQLSYKMQNDGSILVYGKIERIKEFVKKIAAKYEQRSKD
jgi:hypothetical protein